MKSFFKTPEKMRTRILVAGDLIALSTALLITFWIQATVQGGVLNFLAPITRLPPSAMVVAILNLTAFFVVMTFLFGMVYFFPAQVVGLYEPEGFSGRDHTSLKLIVSVLAGGVVLCGLLHLLGKPLFSPQLWVFHGLLLFSMMVFWRFVFQRAHTSKEPYRVLLLGDDCFMQKAVDYISSNGGRGLFRFSKMSTEDFFVGGGKNGHNCEGRVLAGRYDMIVYPIKGRFSRDQLIALVREKFQGIGVCDSLTFYKNTTGSYPVHALDAGWLINLSVSLALKNRLQQRIKRLLDIVVSLIGILIFLPLMVLIALAIKTTRGPVLFVHERLGLNGSPFSLYKFRTMVPDAEKQTGPVWAEKDDPRVTSIGRILRKTRLDELPQFFNVLKGDMSLVGPRPIRKFFAEKLEARFPYYFLRFYFKPGLTGWAQVLGSYADSEEGQLKKLEYELFYINEYSLLMDVGILFRTMKKVVLGTGQ